MGTAFWDNYPPVDVQGPLMFAVSQCLVFPWFEFQITDATLLAGDYFQDDKTALFIASLNDKSELRELLERCGEAIETQGVYSILFRTNHPAVLRWVARFNPHCRYKQGHRARYVLTKVRCPEFFDLCVKAYRRSLKAQAACPP